jgi:alpha-glucoside transport system permease protein
VGELFSTTFTIVLGLGCLAAGLLLLYGLTMKLPRKIRNVTQTWLFLFPALFTLFIGLFVPALKTIYSSFFNDDFKKPKFIGLGNFKEIFTTKDQRLVVLNSLTWVVLGTFAVVVFALTIARFADGMRGESVAKSAMFIPTCISLAGAGITWRFVYAAPPIKVGLLNALTKSLHFPTGLGGDGQHLWMTERAYGILKPPSSLPGFNTFLLIVIFVWAQAGLAIVIFSAAIKGVPEPLIEAAKVDGATNRQVFYRVSLPYIRSTIITVATLTVIAGFKAFDIVAASTGGNAGTSTIANQWYVMQFLQDRAGFSAAYAVILFVLVIPFVVINRRAQRRAEELMAA